MTKPAGEHLIQKLQAGASESVTVLTFHGTVTWAISVTSLSSSNVKNRGLNKITYKIMMETRPAISSASMLSNIACGQAEVGHACGCSVCEGSQACTNAANSEKCEWELLAAFGVARLLSPGLWRLFSLREIFYFPS